MLQPDTSGLLSAGQSDSQQPACFLIKPNSIEDMQRTLRPAQTPLSEQDCAGSAPADIRRSQLLWPFSAADDHGALAGIVHRPDSMHGLRSVFSPLLRWRVDVLVSLLSGYGRGCDPAVGFLHRDRPGLLFMARLGERR